MNNAEKTESQIDSGTKFTLFNSWRFIYMALPHNRSFPNSYK